MRSFTVKVLLVLSIFIFAATGFAQQSSGKSGVGFYIGGSHFVGGASDDGMIFPWYGLGYVHTFDPRYGIEIYGLIGSDRPRDKNHSGINSYFSVHPGTPYRTFVYPLMINFRYNLQPDQRFNPYLSFGTGVLFWETKNVSRENHPFPIPSSGTQVSGSRRNVLANLAVGFEYFLSEQWAIDFSGRYHQLISQHYDMSGLGDKNTGNGEIRAGISWYFGGWTDTDGDGIKDSEDRCPGRAEDFDGYQDEDGCPDPDNDGDGILDVNDKCPQQAEDFDGFQDEDGCPDLDNDQDGIVDSKDQCPNIAEDMDGYQDEDGCPDPDNDQDGIPDSTDQCPNQPETYNSYQDKDGCPDEAPKVLLNETEPTILKGVNFPSGSTTLTENAKRILDTVFNTLMDNRDMRIEVGGYTDSKGDSNFNLRLSQKRAESVKDYLVRRGIDSSRIVAVGYGEQEPIAPNTTEEGRAKNRRIEIIKIR